MEPVYSIKEAAEKWHFSESTLYGAIKAGDLKARLRRGTKRGYKVTESIMEDWFNNETEVAGDTK